MKILARNKEGKTEFLDLLDNEIKIAKSVVLISEINTRLGDFSYSFSVAKTEKMMDFFGFLYDARTETKKIKYEASLYVGLSEFATGFLIVEAIVNNEINCRFYSGNTNAFEKLSDLSLKDLDYSGIEIFWNINDIDLSQNFNYLDGYFWLFANYGQHSQRRLFNSLTLLDFRPALFYHFLVKEIFTKAGYSVEGDLLSDSNFCNCALVCTDEIRPKNFKEFEQSAQSNNLYDIDYYNYSSSLPVETFSVPILFTLFDSQFTANHFVCPETAEYIVNIELEFTYRNGQIQSDSNIRITTDIPNNELVFQPSAEDNATVAGTYSTSFEAILVQSNIYSFSIEYDWYNTSEWTSIFIPDSALTISFFKVTFTKKIDSSISNLPIDVKAAVPDLSVLDFLRTVLNQFCAIMYFDEIHKKFIINKLQNVYNENAYDFSNKIDVEKEILFENSYFIESFAKTNTILYEKDDSDEELKLYNEKYGVGFGDGQIKIENEELNNFLEDKKNIIQLSFAATTNKRCVNEIVTPENNFLYLSDLPFIPIYETEIKEYDNLPVLERGFYYVVEYVSPTNKKSGGLALKNYINIQNFEGYNPFNYGALESNKAYAIKLEKNKDIIPRCVFKSFVIPKNSIVAKSYLPNSLYNYSFHIYNGDNAVNINLAIAYFVKSPLLNSVTFNRFSLCYSTPKNSTLYEIINLVDLYFLPIKNMIENNTVFEVEVDLKYFEIVNLDFTKPVFIRRFSSLFLIQQLEFSENELCKIKLIKL